MIKHVSSDGTEWWAPAFEMTVKRVGPECNHHWMSDMEGRASRIAKPLVLGESVPPLLEQDQLVLAKWCFLKVITLELGRPEDQSRTYPDSFYAGFREFKSPPGSSCSVAIGQRDISGTDPYVWFRSQGGKGTFPELGDTATYRTALTIGHLVIDVIGVIDPRANVQVQDLGSRLVRIWPASRTKVTLPTERFVRIANNDLL